MRDCLYYRLSLFGRVSAFILLRPDPLKIATMIEANRQENELGNKTESLNKNALNKRVLTVGATVMVLTQIVMVAIMRMTPVHMKPHGHGLSEVGIVIGFHVDAMYLPSIVTVILAL